MKFTAWAAAAALTACGIFGSALALDEAKDEKEKLKACEAALCEVVTKKSPTTGDFTCPLQKTWAKAKIQEGASGGAFSWGFGDARCSITLKLPHADIVKAVSEPEFTLQFPDQVVTCEIEQDKTVTPVKLTLAPKVEFKGGEAKKAWINLKDVDGPTAMKALAFTAAKLEDTTGIFHGALIKAINGHVGPKCKKS